MYKIFKINMKLLKCYKIFLYFYVSIWKVKLFMKQLLWTAQNYCHKNVWCTENACTFIFDFLVKRLEQIGHLNLDGTPHS